MTTTQKNNSNSILHDKTRMCIFPIPKNRQELWDFYKMQRTVGWEAEEISFAKDVQHFKTLTSQEQWFVEHIMAFFAIGDGYVIENLIGNFTQEFDCTEIQYNYGWQAQIEQVHAETYAKQIDAIITDPKRKAELFAKFHQLPAIKKKTDWITQWMDGKQSIGERLVAFAAVEGILFSGSFCAIYWLKERGLMPGLSQANDLISRDEGLHTDLACLINKYLNKDERADTQTVHKIIKSAVETEKSFICDALPCSLIGMNSKLMSNYIEFVADRLCVQLGHPKPYFTANPFTFMIRISLSSKKNFFELTPTEYGKAGVGFTEEETTIGFDAAF